MSDKKPFVLYLTDGMDTAEFEFHSGYINVTVQCHDCGEKTTVQLGKTHVSQIHEAIERWYKGGCNG